MLIFNKIFDKSKEFYKKFKTYYKLDKYFRFQIFSQ